MAGSDWVNGDGLLVRFGPNQGVRGAKAGVTTGAGKRRELVFTVDLTGAARTVYSTDLNNDGTADGFTSMDTPLPAGALILSQQVRTLVTPAGGTNFAVGTYLKNGTADNAAGIRTTAGANGTQVGTQLTADRYVTVVTTGTYTAGKVQVIVEYDY